MTTVDWSGGNKTTVALSSSTGDWIRVSSATKVKVFIEYTSGTVLIEEAIEDTGSETEFALGSFTADANPVYEGPGILMRAKNAAGIATVTFVPEFKV